MRSEFLEPTNGCATYFSKVDDDCLVPYSWARLLREAHEENPEFGVVACWHFLEEDFVPKLASKKIQEFAGAHKLMRNCWVGGSGYLMKRKCIQHGGRLQTSDGFTSCCIRLARLGWVNGWYYPFLYQEHLDDPRSSYSLLKSDDDMRRYAPLSAVNNGVTTIVEWQAQLTRSAHLIQRAPYDPRYYSGWRHMLTRLYGRVKRSIGSKRQW